MTFVRRLRTVSCRVALWIGVLTTCVAAGSACGGSPSPTAPGAAPGPGPSTPAPSANAAGTLVDGVAGTAVGGALVVVDGLGQATSSANGSFAISTTAPAALRRITVTSPGTVERVSWASLPGTSPIVSLMPAVLSVDAFDQMYRGSGAVLRRWATSPTLVIERSVLRFTSATDTSYVATAASVSPAEASELLADLLFALPRLTGDTFQGFAGVQTPLTAEGQTVSVPPAGTILVARYDGIRQATGFVGYGRWFWDATGTIRSGMVMLDLGYDTSTSPNRRPVRWHELGHALGYNHVTAVPSLMAPIAVSEPTSFDRDSARLAFARPILNRYPDADPEPASAMLARSLEIAGSSGAP